MTTEMDTVNKSQCPAEELLKSVVGKWKPQILKLSVAGPVRFNALLRQLEGSNKQSISTALKELEAEGVLIKETLKIKPLHIEYRLSEKGEKLISLMRQFEDFE